MGSWFEFLLLSATLLALSDATPLSTATEQVLDILSDPAYRKEIRPPSPGPTNVDVNMYIRNLDVDDVSMSLKVDMTFRMEWRDQRIRYNVPEVATVTLSDFSPLWIPDLFFKNSKDVHLMESIMKEAYVRVDKAGNIVFSSRFNIAQSCPMDLTRFPHDTQECLIMIASYGFTTDDIELSMEKENPVQIDGSIHLSRFTLKSIANEYCHSKTITGEYSCISIRLTLERVFAAYLMEWYVPCLCMVLVAFCSQMLPIENVVGRLIVTIAPLMTLMVSAFSYISSRRASVSYITAVDVFSGLSFMAIFATLLHSIVGFYCNGKKCCEVQETTTDDEGASKPTMTKKERFLAFFKKNGDYVTRVTIVGGYAIFIFLYLLAYST